MARITVEDCLEKVQNRFALVMIAAQRVQDLKDNNAPMIEDYRDNKEIVTALREIASGKITIPDGHLEERFLQVMKESVVYDAEEDDIDALPEDTYEMGPASESSADGQEELEVLDLPSMA